MTLCNASVLTCFAVNHILLWLLVDISLVLMNRVIGFQFFQQVDFNMPINYPNLCVSILFTLLFNPTKKHLQILLRKCLIIKSPLTGSNRRPTDYKSVQIPYLYKLILTDLNLIICNIVIYIIFLFL
jgi:hypothetical protein